MPTLPALILLTILLASVLAPILTPYAPTKQDLYAVLQPPGFAGGSAEHILGTDSLGRDLFSRLLYGGRVSMSIAALALVVAVIVGTAVGLISGYSGGQVDSILMRVTDMVLSLPMLLLALVIAIALGPSFVNLFLILGLMIWPRTARLVRADTLLIKRQDYCRYARAIGVPPWLVVVRHLIPNVAPTILVMVTLEVGHVILLEAAMSFLGAGIPAPQPSWGTIIADGRALIASGWWIALFPGIAVSLTVMSCNLLGDWLRDRLDPKFNEV